MSSNKPDTSPTTTPLGQSTTNSPMAIQKLLREAEEKKEAAAETMRTRCKICFKEITPKRLCGGHGGGGGGAAGGESEADDDTLSTDISLTDSSTPVIDTTSEMEPVFNPMDNGALIDSSPQSFNPEIIAELIAKGLLDIINDRESLTLTIKLLCEPESLSEEERVEFNKFIEAVLKELDDFKEENNITQDCVDIIRNEKGDLLSLQITLPTLALYDAFIKRLANNLVPMQNAELQVANEPVATESKSQTPFSMEPKPSSGTNDDEKEKTFNPSPFATKLKPGE